MEDYLFEIFAITIALVYVVMYLIRTSPEVFHETFNEAFMSSLSYQDLLLDELLTKMLDEKKLREALDSVGDPFSPLHIQLLRNMLFEECLSNLPLVRVRFVYLTKTWCVNWQPRINRLHENMATLYQPKTGIQAVTIAVRGGIFIVDAVDFDVGHQEIEITDTPDLFTHRQLLTLLHDASIAVLITKRAGGDRRNPPKEKEARKALLPDVATA